MAQPLIINNWQEAIADSPHLGFGNMKNVDILGVPGSVRPATAPVSLFPVLSSTFTADPNTDICSTVVTTVPQTSTAVTLTTTGTLPAGLTTGTVYFLIRVTSSTFKLATSIANAVAGTAINITDAGTGTHTVTALAAGTINHFVRDSRTNTLFAQDSNGRVWYFDTIAKLLIGNTLTAAVGNGLAIFRNSDGTATYLFAFRNGAIDVVNVFGTTQLEAPSWSNSWQTTTSATSHQAKLAQDNIIYFCNDRYVGSIMERAGQVFDPGNAATYTYNASALDLPLGALTNWLDELGVNLLICPSNLPYIYPWDRVSDSFSLPIPVPENGNKIKNIGNIVYILAGTHGNIYTTQGTYTRLFKTIPEYVSNNTTSVLSNPITWGGIEAVLGNLLVGVGTTTTGNSGAYIFYPDGRFYVDKQPTTGTSVRPTAFSALNEFYQMGYAGGVDTVDTNRYNDTSLVLVETELYRVADKVGKAKYSRLEIDISKPVVGSVVIKYRTDLTTAFADLATFTTGVSAFSYTSDIGLTDIENLQLQIGIAGADLMEVRLIP